MSFLSASFVSSIFTTTPKPHRVRKKPDNKPKKEEYVPENWIDTPQASTAGKPVQLAPVKPAAPESFVPDDWVSPDPTTPTMQHASVQPAGYQPTAFAPAYQPEGDD